MDLNEIRQKYPQYNSLSDNDLADKLYNKYKQNYPDRNVFNQKIGLAGQQGKPVASGTTGAVGMGQPAPKVAPTVKPEAQNFPVGTKGDKQPVAPGMAKAQGPVQTVKKGFVPIPGRTVSMGLTEDGTQKKPVDWDKFSKDTQTSLKAVWDAGQEGFGPEQLGLTEDSQITKDLQKLGILQRDQDRGKLDPSLVSESIVRPVAKAYDALIRSARFGVGSSVEAVTQLYKSLLGLHEDDADVQNLRNDLYNMTTFLGLDFGMKFDGLGNPDREIDTNAPLKIAGKTIAKKTIRKVDVEHAAGQAKNDILKGLKIDPEEFDKLNDKAKDTAEANQVDREMTGVGLFGSRVGTEEEDVARLNHIGTQLNKHFAPATPAAKGKGPTAAQTKPTVAVTNKAVAQAQTNAVARKASNNVISHMRAIFAPGKVSNVAEGAAADIRREVGTATQHSRQVEQSVNPFVKDFNRADDKTRLDVIDYIENRSKGKTLTDPKFQKGADQIRTVYEDFAQQLGSLPKHQQMNFVQDYFTHLWKDPNKADAVAAGGKFGTGRFTKERTIPTIHDGLAHGLELQSTNPLEAVMHYTEGMGRFLAKERIVEKGIHDKTIKYFIPGRAPPGMSPLMQTYNRAGNQAHAPHDYARVFNNYISQGFHGLGKEFGGTYDFVQGISNATTRSVLAINGFHALNIASGGLFDSLGLAIGELSHGFPGLAAKTLAKAPLAGVAKVIEGKKLMNQYLGIAKNGPMYSRVADLAAKANARVKDGNLDFRATAAGSYIKAFSQAALKGQLKADLKTLGGNPIKQALPFVSKQIGRLIDTISAPLFDHYIPMIKNGAFYENMSSWLKQHPMSTPAEQEAMARTLADSMDNRYGEMQRDNLFWNKMLGQTAQLAMLSDTWYLGTVRELGGGVVDLAKAVAKGDYKGITTRTNYTMGFAIGTALIGGIYQYLKTGKPPDGIKDLIAPQTGGKNNDGSPERVILPGHLKDVIGTWNDPIRELGNKVAPFWSLAHQVLTAKDWKGQTVNPSDTWGGLIRGEFNLIKDAFTPISVQNVGNKQPGSGISDMESVMGLRPAPSYLSEPEKVAYIEKQKKMKDLRTKIISEKYQLKANPSDLSLAKQIKDDTDAFHELLKGRKAALKSYKGTLPQ